MSWAVSAPRDGTAATTGLPAAFDQSPSVFVPGPFRRATGLLGDLVGAMALVFCIPLAILAAALPIVLVLRLFLWIVGRL